MATMTAATATESAIRLRIHEAQLQLREAEQALEATKHEVSGCEDLLQQLSAERTQECLNVALGKRGTPEAFDRKIQNLKDRLTGLAMVQGRRENEVVDRRVTLHELNDELGQIERQKAIQAEDHSTRVLIDEIETAIETRARSQKVIVEGVHKLRTRKYLSEKTRCIGADAAQRLERLANGMRP